MQRSTLFVALTLAASMLFTSTSAFASEAPTTWTALGETGSPITDVQITKGDSTYDIKMNLTGPVVAGNTYSVYLSPTAAVYDDFLQDVSASAINKLRALSVSFGDLTNWTETTDGWEQTTSTLKSSKLSSDKKTLSWEVEESDVLFQTFWFAGQVTNSISGVNQGKTSVSATPIPGAAWLLGSGILGLVALRRKQAGLAC